MVHTRCIYLLYIAELLLVSVLNGSTHGLNIYIDNQSGNDNEGCETTQLPCRTLQYAFNKAAKNNSVKHLNLLLQGGEYKLDSAVNFYGSQSEGNGLDSFKLSSGSAKIGELVKVTPTAGETKVKNLNFDCSKDSTTHNCWTRWNVLVENLIFTGFRGFSALRIFCTSSVVIRKCHFTDNDAGLYAVDSVVTLDACRFERNHGSCNWENFWLGGAFAFVFHRLENLPVAVKSSQFVNNTSCLDQNEIANLSSPFNPFNNTKFYGSALTVVYWNHSNGNTFQVDSCEFSNNTAVFGGAMFLSVADNSCNNSFLVDNSMFVDNKAFRSGGAFELKTFDKSSNNNIRFQNVIFRRNSAIKSGGAGKIVFQSNYERAGQIPVRFFNTTFEENRAGLDGALGISSNSPRYKFKESNAVHFENVKFLANRYYMENSSFYYTGALRSSGIDLSLSGAVLFADNSINSALYLVHACVKVDGNVTFYRNVASLNGGAISLTDGSTLLLTAGASVLFHKNFAWVNGGALFYESNMVDNEVYSYNPLCFIQYDAFQVPASKWNVSVQFIENGATVKGAAIYATSVRQCIWTEDSPFDYDKAFRWSHRFKYSNNYIGDRPVGEMRTISKVLDIATDVYRFEYNGTKVAAQPGDVISLNITAKDEYSQESNSLAVLSNFIKNQTPSTGLDFRVENPLIYVSRHRNSSFSFKTSANFSYKNMIESDYSPFREVNIVAKQSVFGARVSIIVHGEICKLGYKYSSELSKCVCDENKHVKWCNGDVINIATGYWANRSQHDPTKLITFICPRDYCTCRHEANEVNCQFLTTDPNAQCHTDRRGPLCGTCKHGKSISLPSYSCIDCRNQALSIFTLVAVLIVVLGLCVAVIYFNPHFSDFLKGIFFYTQMLPYLFNGNSSAKNLAVQFSTILNSVAVGSMPVEMCLFDGLDLINAVLVSYAIPLSATLILVTVYVLSKRRVLTFRRDSPFGAFWILITMIYKFLSETTLLSLACFKLDDELIFFFDGSQKCFRDKHLALFIPSALILIFIVLPLPILIVLIINGYVQVPPHISDIIAQGYKPKYRWWCAVDLFRRLIFAVVFIFIPYLDLRKALLFLTSVATCLSHTLALPYESKYANKGESFLLTCLTMISGFQAMQSSSIQTTATIIVIAVTIVYTGSVIIYLSVKNLRALNKRRRASNSNNRLVSMSPRADCDGRRQYNVPQRVYLADKKAKAKKYKKEALEQPLIQDEGRCKGFLVEQTF
eukprot:gene480-1125_t